MKSNSDPAKVLLKNGQHLANKRREFMRAQTLDPNVQGNVDKNELERLIKTHKGTKISASTIGRLERGKHKVEWISWRIVAEFLGLCPYTSCDVQLFDCNGNLIEPDPGCAVDSSNSDGPPSSVVQTSEEGKEEVATETIEADSPEEPSYPACTETGSSIAVMELAGPPPPSPESGRRLERCAINPDQLEIPAGLNFQQWAAELGVGEAALRQALEGDLIDVEDALAIAATTKIPLQDLIWESIGLVALNGQRLRETFEQSEDSLHDTAARLGCSLADLHGLVAGSWVTLEFAERLCGALKAEPALLIKSITENEPMILNANLELEYYLGGLPSVD